MSHPFRMPKGIDDYLANGTTPDEQVMAEAQSCVGDPESYERALARQAERTRRPRVMRTADGRPFMAALAAALGADETPEPEPDTCRYCQKPIRRCTRTKSRGFIHASGDCKGWVHDVDGWHSCVREGPKWIFAEPAPKEG